VEASHHNPPFGGCGHIDQALVSAGVVEAERDQVPHAKVAHVAERHRRAGSVMSTILLSILDSTQRVCGFQYWIK
jgi:hypothetical protein